MGDIRLSRAAPHSPRSADLAGRHTLYLGCLDESGKLRTILPTGFRWNIHWEFHHDQR